jgi:Bacterial protein of unknown function (DUF885)
MNQLLPGLVVLALFSARSMYAQSLPSISDEAMLTPAEAVHVFGEDRRLIERRHPLSGGQARLKALTLRIVQELASLAKRDLQSIDTAGRIDHLLLLDHCRAAKQDLQREAERSARIRAWIPASDLIEALVEQGQRLEDLPAEATLAAFSAAQKSTDAMTKSLNDAKGAKPDGILARAASRRCGDYGHALRNWVRGREGYDPVFSWWFPKSAKALGDSLKKLALRLEAIAVQAGGKGGILGSPIGKEALMAALRRERIAYTPEELIEIGKRELEWCRVEREKASRELGCGTDWKKALDLVKQDHVLPGRQPALIRELAEQAVTFLEDRQLIRIPALAKEGWRVEMMSAQRQRYTPYFTGGEVISVAYPTTDMDSRQKSMTMRGNNRHFCKATVHHELIPGHHLQGFMASRYHPYRRMFRTPFLVEGWALYWELRLWDLGFADNAKEKMGMLFWRSHRCARIIFSLSFHLGKMSPQEAIDFLVDQVGHERKNATAEVRRSFEGGYSPLYQAAYMLGGLQFRALHRELVASGKMSEQDFHEAILKQNSIPVSLIRARLTGRIPSSEANPQWRFYDLDSPK